MALTTMPIFRTILLTCAASGALSHAEETPLVKPGERILMLGDSITRGYGFGNYTDPAPLRSVYGTAEVLLRENVRRPPEFLRLSGGWQGLNPNGAPIGPVDSLRGQVRYCIDRGEIRPGDWLVYEDAGEIDMFIHPAPKRLDHEIYPKYRQALGEMIRATDSVISRQHFIAMTMFDYQPRCKWCRWDEPLDDGVHTGNDIIRDTAAELGIPVIDMNQIMDTANELIAAKGYGRTVGPDGIHPNVYGNFVMALAILHSLGYEVKTWKLNMLGKHFRHPEGGGDVPAIWGFTRDPSDEERIALVREIRDLVARMPKMSVPKAQHQAR
jgi:lysophospholipase L1-like esterase